MSPSLSLSVPVDIVFYSVHTSAITLFNSLVSRRSLCLSSSQFQIISHQFKPLYWHTKVTLNLKELQHIQQQTLKCKQENELEKVNKHLFI